MKYRVLKDMPTRAWVTGAVVEVEDEARAENWIADGTLGKLAEGEAAEAEKAVAEAAKAEKEAARQQKNDQRESRDR